jgi:hypothetical protein
MRRTAQILAFGAHYLVGLFILVGLAFEGLAAGLR